MAEWDSEKADQEANIAESELEDIDEEALHTVANWWSKHFMVCGHKRLARILLQYKEKEAK